MAKAATTKAGDRPRFDIDTVRDLAGEKTFERGEDYHLDGLVEILSIEPERVLAQVAGTEVYRTELTGHDKEIGGECSCPAFEDRGFCKHMVAVALTANAAGGDAEEAGIGTLARIRDHLKKQGVDSLVAMIVDLAERDQTLFRRLDLAAMADQADDRTLEAGLRKAIDAATHTRGFVDYHEAGGWADGVDSALDALADLASGGRAALVLRLVEHAIGRIDGAVGQIDDSDGQCTELLGRAQEIHLAAARAARPDPVGLAHDLFAREMEDDYGTFDGAATLYADVLGEQGLAEYRRLAAEAWAKLPPLAAPAGNRTDVDGNYNQLKAILDFFAEREGDVEARIALRAKDLSSPWNYLQLAGFYREQGRDAEALRWAEEGLWIFEGSRPDQRLLLLAVDLLLKAGRESDAQAQLWRAFEMGPSLELYGRLRGLGGEAARERVLRFLQARLAREVPTRWHHPADFLIHILMREEMFDASWAAVQRHGASMDVREALARASEGAFPREAVEVYAERVEGLADGGGNPAYEQAAALIARMAALRGAAEQAAYVTALKLRFGRKRNLMKLLG